MNHQKQNKMAVMPMGFLAFTRDFQHVKIYKSERTDDEFC